MLCSYRNILVSRRLAPHFGVNLVGQCHQAASAYPCPQISFPPPKFDYSFLLDPVSLEKMRKNIELRKSEADLDKVVRLHRLFSQTGDRELEKDLLEETTRLPNMCTERVLDMADDNKILYQGSVLQPGLEGGQHRRVQPPALLLPELHHGRDQSPGVASSQENP